MGAFSAVRRTFILISGMLLVAAVWGIGRIPDANLLMIVFTSLSSGLLADIPSFYSRFRLVSIIACYGSAVQFLVSVSREVPLLQMVILMGIAYFIFGTLADHRAGCVAMITGCLAFAAPAGWEAAAGRSIDIFICALVVMAVTTLGNAGGDGKKAPPPPPVPYSPYQTLLLSAELGLGVLISELLHLQQGVWIMLTILFIRMSESPARPGKKLALQRVFAAPAGIIAGGFLLGTFVRVDDHIVYLVFAIGAAGFFILYNYGNFFLFSIIFMIAMSFASDWITGPYHRVHFWDNFSDRSISTLLGSLIEWFLRPRPDWKKGDV
ncbi:MAG: FUSC family protein [Lentisphaeria bacterium]|nr:FUSC family protein [Lentisphaeria bacterium]